jgi:hypothetical protein
MTYAPSTYWDHFFHRRHKAGTDLDWGDQWVEIASGTRNSHFKKCVWRGVAQV